MSTKKYSSQTYKYQLNQGPFRFAVPTKTLGTAMTQNRHSRFSHNSVINKSITDIYPEELSQFYVFNYTFQDKADESNINFYDSNLKKYRTRSTLRNSGGNILSRSFNNSFNIKLKNNNVSAGKNTFTYNKNNRNNLMTLNQNNSVNSQNYRRDQNSQNKYNITQLSKNYENSSRQRAEIIKQLKKEKDELLGPNYYYLSPQKQEQKKSANNINIIDISRKGENSIKNKEIPNKQDNSLNKVDNYKRSVYNINKVDNAKSTSLNKTISSTYNHRSQLRKENEELKKLKDTNKTQP